MSPYLEVLLWLMFGSFGAAVVIYLALLAWAVTLKARRGQLFRRRATPVGELLVPTAGTLVVRSDVFKVGMIWTSLLVLVPLLFLALWAAAVETMAQRIGVGFVFAIVHPLLIWQFIRLGTHVQREVELSQSSLIVHPVFGRSREIIWSAVERVEDVTFVGPGVSGLYLYVGDGTHIVLDRWLPEWETLRATVGRFTPSAKWSLEQRAAIG